jgi:hypothetical protein
MAPRKKTRKSVAPKAEPIRTEQPRAVEIIKGFGQAESARSNVDISYRDIERLVMPSFSGSNTEDRKSEGHDDRPVSSVPTSEAILLGSNVYSHSFSNSDRNFALRAAKEEDREGMKKTLQDWTNIMHRFMQASNFGEVYGEFTRIWSNFGTGIVGIEYDTESSQLVFSSIPITGNVYIFESFNGRVNGLMRLLQLRASDALAMFGEDGLCDKAKKALDDMSKVNEKFDYILNVQENPKYDAKRSDKESMRYKSEYVCRTDKRIVKSGGYRTWPYPTSRFIKAHDGSPYGLGICHVADGAIREINTAEAQLVDAIQMQSHSPVVVKDDEQLEIDEILPDTVIYTTGEITQFKTTSDPAVIQARIDQLTIELRRQFFSDVFLALTQKRGNKTIPEVEGIESEKFAAVGPMIARLRSEFWGTLINTILELLIHAGEIKIPEGMDMSSAYEVNYISQLDTRLGLMDHQKTMQAVTAISGLIAAATEVPEINKVLKVIPMAKAIAEDLNVDYDYIVTDEERAKMDAQAAAAAEEAAAMQKQELDQKAVAPVDTSKAPEDGSPMAAQIEAATQSPA